MTEPDGEFNSEGEPEFRLEPAASAGAQPEQQTSASPFTLEPGRSSFGVEKLTLAWRVLLFLFLTLIIAPQAIFSLATDVFGRQRGSLNPEFLLFMEVANFALIAGLTLLLSYMERTPWDSYGLPWKQAFKANFWVGALLGLAEASLVVGLIELFGGFSLEGWALRGSAIIGWGLFHFVLFIFVGLYEEFLFRGYPQWTMTKLIGFWPAAVLLSLGFGLVHLSNRGENWVGAASVALVGLLFAFTLKRTGNLWYAVGLHAGFDWAESFLYSVPDSGQLLRGHLWNSSLHGPDWLTGGTVGPEGSVFCFVTMMLQFLVVSWLFPAENRECVQKTPAASESD
jgi:uncharacterized protein